MQTTNHYVPHAAQQKITPAWVANLITNSITGNGFYYDHHKWPFGISLFFAAILSWFIGRLLAKRKAKTLIEKDTGKEIVVEPYHALFFIRMHWWGPILATTGIVLVIMGLFKN